MSVEIGPKAYTLVAWKSQLVGILEALAFLC